MIPKALHDQFLSQKALIILASSVSPESSKLPPAPRSLRSTCPSSEHSHPHAMANWFLLSPEASVFCYFSRGVSPPTLSTNKTGFVLTTPKSFYRIHTTIGSGLIFFTVSLQTASFVMVNHLCLAYPLVPEEKSTVLDKAWISKNVCLIN